MALAPLLVMGPASYWILWLRPATHDPLTELVAGLAGGFAAWAAPPSSQDWFIALRYPAGTLLMLVIIALVLA